METTQGQLKVGPDKAGQAKPNWEMLPGSILDGGYELKEILAADERRGTLRVRVLGDRTIDAYATFFVVEETAAEQQVAAWTAVRSWPHSNVSKPLAAGERTVDGVVLAYLVGRRPEETLNSVLDERALSGEEAKEILLAGARALEYLDRQGLTHASISPEAIFASEDLIQLSADRVRAVDSPAKLGATEAEYLAPESSEDNSTTAAAVWCLGATVFETLTQKAYDEASREQVRSLPLGWVLVRCLDPEPGQRFKPDEIAAAIEAGPPVQDAAPPAALVSNPPVESLPAALEQSGVGAPAQEQLSPLIVPTENGSVLIPAATIAAEESEPQTIADPLEPSEDEPAVPGAIPSVSQNRAKSFRDSEFDYLTAPKGAQADVAAKASAAAVSAGSPPRLTRVGGAGSGAPASQSEIDHWEAARAAAKVPGFASGDTVRAGPVLSGRRRSDELDEEPGHGRLWTYLAASALVLVLLFVALRARTHSNPEKAGASAGSDSPVAASPHPAAAASANSTAAPKPIGSTRTLQPEAPAASTRPVEPAATGVAAQAVWRVVVFTFNRQEDAEKRAHALNAKHPQLRAQVFTPDGRSGPYLVSVGGRLTRAEAIRFRTRALGEGVPRDAYVQNYSR